MTRYGRCHTERLRYRAVRSGGVDAPCGGGRLSVRRPDPQRQEERVAAEVLHDARQDVVLEVRQVPTSVGRWSALT
jgi:hypothetical protein